MPTNRSTTELRQAMLTAELVALAATPGPLPQVYLDFEAMGDLLTAAPAAPAPQPVSEPAQASNCFCGPAILVMIAEQDDPATRRDNSLFQAELTRHLRDVPFHPAGMAAALMGMRR